MKENRIKKFVIIGVLILFWGNGYIFSQSDSLSAIQTYSLNEVLDSIAARNPGLQQFGLQAASSNAMSKASLAWSAPMIGLGLSEFPYGKPSSGMMESRRMLMLHLSQTFPNFHKQKKTKQYQQSFAAQYQDNRATLQNALFTQAKLAYYQAYIAAKKLEVVAQQSRQLKLLKKIVEGRLQFGKANLSNSYKIEAKLSDLQLLKVRLKSIIQSSEAALHALMHLPTEQRVVIDTTTNVEKEPIRILQVDSSFLLSHRSDIAHTVDVMKTLELKQAMVKSSSRPRFSISWDNMRMPMVPKSGQHAMYEYGIMVSMSIPIVPWASKSYKAKTKAIDFQRQALQKKKEYQIAQALGNIRKDWFKLQAVKKSLAVFEKEVIPAYEKTYQAYLNEYGENTGNIFQILSAWNDLTGKRLEYFDKLSLVLTTRVVLEAELQANEEND